jgi:hypothetical protein
MAERASPQGKHRVQLCLAAGQRIMTPLSEPVLGWLGGPGADVAEALVLPAQLLDPRATENIFYSCNLPAPPAKAATPLAKAISGPEGKVLPKAGAAFMEASLPGGHVLAVMPGGRAAIIRFRWLCIPSQSKGTSWRCFVQSRDDSWTAAGHDYLFDAGGFLVTSPGKLTLALGNHRLILQHPEGMLTCFPCKSGRVKITRLRADGWEKRELLGLWLLPDRSISARFSDGTESVIATATTAPAAAAMAA